MSCEHGGCACRAPEGSAVRHEEKKRFLPEGLPVILAGGAVFAAALAVSAQPVRLLLFVAAYLICGGEVLFKAVKNILRGEWMDENFLMSLATVGAFAIGEYPEAVAVMLFYQTGEFFLHWAVHRSRRSVRSLMELQPETVLFDVTSYDAVKDWIEAGNGDFDEMKYQTVHSSTEGNADISSLGLYDYYLNNPSSWRPGSSKPDWFIIYFTAKSTNDWQNAENHDFLMLNLGNNGWITFTTPVIVKGKYKVSMQFGNAKSMDFIHNAESGSNGGQMEFTIDEANTKTVSPYMSSDVHTGGSYMFTSTIYDEIEFTSTSSHQFKLVMKDPAASTNSNYRIMIDYILFEPITETTEE